MSQGETKILKLKNLRPGDFSDYTCEASVRKVCGIRDKSALFRLTNTTGEREEASEEGEESGEREEVSGEWQNL